MENWLKLLNEQQLKAVTHIEGPLFLVAGAGTGKTRTLTTRVAYLINEAGIAPNSILAVTFTNKAAKEMMDRIILMSGPYASSVWISTFHSLGYRILKSEIEHLNLGYKVNFNVLDDDDSKGIIRNIIKKLNIDNKRYKVNSLRNKISHYKVFKESLFEDNIEERVYELYKKDLLDNNLLDFDDLQILLLKLFEEHQNVLNYYRDKFSYILVDEFQDTDHIQYKIIKLLALKHKNIFVVGDPDQSIYSFRGADYNNAKYFLKDFGNYQVLDINYRSTNQILNYANKLIKHNYNRPVAKDLKSELGDGKSPIIIRSDSDFYEATTVINEIKRLVISEGYNYDDIAILYRNNALSRNFEDSFIRNNIPYNIYGGISFYQRKEIKDIIAYIKLALDSSLDYYLRRIINEPRRKIGPATISKLEDVASLNHKSLFHAIKDLDIGGQTKFNLDEFYNIINKIKTFIDEMETLKPLVNFVMNESGYKEMLVKDNDDISRDRLDNLNELTSVFVQGEKFYEGSSKDKLKEILDQIALYSNLDNPSRENSVVLSTFHQVKGLEFKAVFMVVMEDGIFPSNLSLFDVKELEEERRIAYVGVTRAKEKLYLSYASQRMLYGNFIYPEPSRFLNEMIETKTKTKPLNKETLSGLSYLKMGDKVNHKAFGDGMVISIKDGVATIAFSDEYGIKKIMESHPSLTKID
ncbi:MAG: UvrD-helicase domain-containing protein [Acholeplasmataceae bacterium]